MLDSDKKYPFSLSLIRERAIAAVEEAAELVTEMRAKLMNREVSIKADRSLVTLVDTACETFLTTKLSEILPASSILAEEFASETALSELTWVLDPIDGTTNFVHGFPMSCISLALIYRERAIVAIIKDLFNGELFVASEDREGCYLNETPVQVSDFSRLSESMLATGFPSAAFARIEEFLEKFRLFMTTTHGIRRLGSAALDLAYVAVGRLDGFFEYELKPWDVAAGAYLVKKAGGMVTDFSGGQDFIFGREILASNGKIHSEFLSHFSTDTQAIK